MSLDVTPGLAEAIANRWPIAALAYIDHPDGEVRLWSGLGTLRHDGSDWIGLGRLGRILGIGGLKTLGVRQLTFELSGVPAEAAKTLNAAVRNRIARAWLAGLTPAGRVNGEAWLVVDGRCDYQELAVADARSAIVRLIVAQPIWSIERAQNLLLTPQWIKKTYGAEIAGLDDVPGMSNRQLNWTLT